VTASRDFCLARPQSALSAAEYRDCEQYYGDRELVLLAFLLFSRGHSKQFECPMQCAMLQPDQQVLLLQSDVATSLLAFSVAILGCGLHVEVSCGSS
jgi:hypothetical protein